MALIDMVGGSDYIAVSRVLCRALGPNTAVMYSELVDRYKFYVRVGKLDNEGMFYATVPDIQEKTGLSDEQQASCLKKLREHRLVYSKRKGLPGKRHILIHENPEFLRALFGLDHDEARNIQKPENPVTSDGISREQFTGKSGSNSPENPAETNLIYNPNILSKNNNNVAAAVIDIFQRNGISLKEENIITLLQELPIKKIEHVASVLSDRQRKGKVKSPVGLLCKKPQEVIEAILNGTFYPDVPEQPKDDTQECEIYSGPCGVRYLPIDIRERESVNG